MLALDHNPYTRLHTSQSRPAGAPYSLSIVNATPLAASVAFFTVTVVNPVELTLTLQEALLPHELRFAANAVHGRDGRSFAIQAYMSLVARSPGHARCTLDSTKREASP